MLDKFLNIKDVLLTKLNIKVWSTQIETNKSLSEEVRKEYLSNNWFKSHPYFIIGDTLIPFITMISASILFFFIVMFLHDVKLESSSTKLIGTIALVALLTSVYFWLKTLIMDSEYPSIHTKTVQKNYLTGMALFIISEVMLFFGFFWAFFWASVSPSIYIGGVWPPVNVIPLNPWNLPLVNTVLLLTSGITINWFYFSLKHLRYTFNFNYAKALYTYIDFNDLLGVNLFFLKLYYPFALSQFLNYLFSFQLFFINRIWNNEKISFSYLPKNIKKSLIFINILPIILYNINKILTKSNTTLKINDVNILNLKKNGLNNSTSLNFNFVNINKIKLTNLKIKNTLAFFQTNLQIGKIFIEKYPFLESILSTFSSTSNFYKTFIYTKWTMIKNGLAMTIILGIVFLILQYLEYTVHATFALNNIYGSVFYFTTGLHGLHVFMGTVGLIITYYRLVHLNEFINASKPHVGITCVVWYWHFVDVVWLFLFLFVYLWS